MTTGQMRKAPKQSTAFGRLAWSAGVEVRRVGQLRRRGWKISGIGAELSLAVVPHQRVAIVPASSLHVADIMSQVPLRSGSGRTTLAHRLVRAGLDE